jgi:hypothetical protein
VGLKLLGRHVGDHHEPQLHKRQHVQPQFSAVEVGLVAVDEAFVFQPLEPPPARGDTQGYLLGQLWGVQGAVLLQQLQNGQIGMVKFLFWCL